MSKYILPTLLIVSLCLNIKLCFMLNDYDDVIDTFINRLNIMTNKFKLEISGLNVKLSLISTKILLMQLKYESEISKLNFIIEELKIKCKAYGINLDNNNYDIKIMNNNDRQCLNCLNLDPNKNYDNLIIKKTYKLMMLKYHPDKCKTFECYNKYINIRSNCDSIIKTKYLS